MLEIVDAAGAVQRAVTKGLTVSQTPVTLAAGPQEVRLVFDQALGRTALRVDAALSGRRPMRFDRARLFVGPPNTWTRLLAMFLDVAWPGVWALWIAWAIAAAWSRVPRYARDAAGDEADRPSVSTLVRDAWPLIRASRATTFATAAALLAIVLYGAVLRIHALSDMYGPLNEPGWAQRLDFAAHELAVRLAPDSLRFPQQDEPYVGSDAFNYIKYAREMTSFSQAHVREPVFLAVTRMWLWALDGRDIAVSFASVTFSILLVPATYLLARAAFGPLAGLLAALMIAVETVAIAWGPKGMRDDASSAFVALTAWSLVRLAQSPGPAVAVTGGVLGALATLTRVTSLGLWLPGLVFASWWGIGGSRGRRLRYALLNVVVGAALVSPYLYNCWRTFGDPLYAVNYHTTFYRAREHVAFDRPQSAGDYVASKLRDTPVQTADTAFYGLVMYPFVTKWTGFAPWMRGLGAGLAACAVIGLFLSACTPTGRLLLALLLLSMVPFAVTWNVPGGGEWRFTMPAYAFYVAATAWTLTGIGRLALATAMGESRRAVTDWWAGLSWRCLAGAPLAAVMLFGVNAALPWFAMREALQHGRTVSVMPAERNDFVLSGAWDVLPRGGCARALGRQQRLRLPLAGDGPWRVDVHLASDQSPSAPPEPVDIAAPGAVRATTVLMRPDDRNQWARVEVDRRDGFFTEMTITAMGAPGPDRDGRPIPPYSLCQVDIVPLGGK